MKELIEKLQTLVNVSDLIVFNGTYNTSCDEYGDMILRLSFKDSDDRECGFWTEEVKNWFTFFTK